MSEPLKDAEATPEAVPTDTKDVPFEEQFADVTDQEATPEAEVAPEGTQDSEEVSPVAAASEEYLKSVQPAVAEPLPASGSEPEVVKAL